LKLTRFRKYSSSSLDIFNALENLSMNAPDRFFFPERTSEKYPEELNPTFM
jgi:hypothetical protein